MSVNIAQKLRILAFHGYSQSAEKFKEKTRFPRKFKKITDFTFITAPFRAPSFEEAFGSTSNDPVSNEQLVQSKEPNLTKHPITDVPGAFSIEEEPVEPADYPSEGTDSFAWYLRRPNKIGTGHYYRGTKACIQFIENVFREKGPFDGVYGFSEGACIVAMLCALQEKKLTKHIQFDFAILGGGYKFVVDEFYQDKLMIPSLHIYGETDQIVVPERSIQLAKCFENPLVVSHPGGHFVPCNAEQKQAYDPFFMEQWSRKYGSNEEQLVKTNGKF